MADDGLAISDPTRSRALRAVSDDGGALFVWLESRNDAPTNLCWQRISLNGHHASDESCARRPPPNPSSTSSRMALTARGWWRDYRSDPNGDIYAQHLSEEVVADPRHASCPSATYLTTKAATCACISRRASPTPAGTAIARYEVWRGVSRPKPREHVSPAALCAPAPRPAHGLLGSSRESSPRSSRRFTTSTWPRSRIRPDRQSPTLVLVEAMSTDGFSARSAPDSGYSVDNLAPVTPATLREAGKASRRACTGARAARPTCPTTCCCGSVQWPIVDSSATALPVTLDDDDRRFERTDALPAVHGRPARQSQRTRRSRS